MIPTEIRAQMIADIKTRRAQADRDAAQFMGSPNQLSPTWRDVDVLTEALDDDGFAKTSDAALRATRAIMAEFSLSDLGLDDIAVFNVVLKAMVTTDNPARDAETTT